MCYRSCQPNARADELQRSKTLTHTQQWGVSGVFVVGRRVFIIFLLYFNIYYYYYYFREG